MSRKEVVASAKRRLAMRICAIVFGLSLVLSISVGTYGYGLKHYLDTNKMPEYITNEEAEQFKPWTPEPEATPDGTGDDDPGTNPTKKPPTGSDNTNLSNLKYNTNLYTVLFIGVDTNKERIEKNKGYQSDVLMLLSIDTVTHESYMISIPRDTLATINKLNSKGQITGTRYTKINAAYSQGGGWDRYSCQNACAAVEALLDVPVRSYIAIDMEGVGPLTDAIGGVYLKISADFSKWGMPKGSYQLLKGNKALVYCRERKNVGTGGSDIERTKRQLQFVSEYLKTVKKKNPIDLLVKNYDLFKKYGRTNIEYPTLYQYAQLLDKAFNSPNKVSLPGRGDSKGNWIVDKSALSKIRTQYFFVEK